MSLISEEDYQHNLEFGIHNLGDYHDLYLRMDVVLLANVYEAFRDTCLKHYKLGSSAFLYISRAGLESLFEAHRNQARAPD